MTALVTLIAIVLIALNADGAAPTLRPAAAPPQVVPLSEAELDCDRYAAPYGADERRGGTRDRPFRSVPRLTRSLRVGETGCLLPGRYRHDDPAQLRRPRTTLVGIDGRARIDGAVWIAERARGAEIRGLDITASDSIYFIPIKIQADRARLVGNRIRGSRSTTCVLIGSTRRAHGVRIEQNWIHHCGRRGKLDHLIYVQDSVRTAIRRNVLTDNRGGWGVHLYPDADRSIVEDNVIDGNLGGVIFGGDGSRTSDDNVVRANVITFSSARWNVEGSWNERAGSGNVAHDNCLYSEGPGAPSGIGREYGFEVGVNVTESPYAVRRQGERRFQPTSQCAALVDPLPQAFSRQTR